MPLLFASLFSFHPFSHSSSLSRRPVPDSGWYPEEDTEAIQPEDMGEEEDFIPPTYYTCGDLDDILIRRSYRPDDEEEEIFAADEEEERLSTLRHEDEDSGAFLWNEDEEP